MSEHGFRDGDHVLVSITDQRIVLMRTGTTALQLQFTDQTKGTITGHVWLTEKCAGMIRGFLRAVGLDPDKTDIAQLDPKHANAISILGKEVYITCKEEEYRGRWTTKVKYIDAPKPLTANFESLNKAVKECKQSEDAAEAEPKF